MTKKRVILFFISVFLIFVGYNWQIIIYGIQQGGGQLNILTSSVDVVELMNDVTVEDSIKIKLKFIQEIKQFAQDSLGLVKTDNYTTYYEQNEKPILWVVTACSPFEMKEYKWDYPLLGELGYKGFFDKNLANNEAEKLSTLGYDVDVGEVNAWSTLGWFQDPILSSMLDKDEGEIARLIIHELTHTTIYIADDSDFNENLATFIGDNGALKYLKHKYGEQSQQVNKYQNHIDDLEKIAYHLLVGSNQLETLYSKMGKLNEQQKQRLKRKQIEFILANLDTIHFSTEHKFEHLKSDSFHPNNTFFITYVMYRGKQAELDSLFETRYGSDFRKFVEYFRND